MNPLKRIFAWKSAGPDLLRLVVSAILFTHGSYRLSRGEAVVLGDILKEVGMPAAHLSAYLVCLAETCGTFLLALRLLVYPVSLILITTLATGILLFHRHNGFFVVGPGEGGWEYSALLITCLVVTLWENRGHRLY